MQLTQLNPIKNLLGKTPILYLLSLLLALPVNSHALPQSNPVPGGIVLLAIDNNHIASSARFNRRQLASFSIEDRRYLLVGLPLSIKPGTHHVMINDTEGKLRKLGFEVKPKTYKAQYLTIKNKRKVNPYEKDMPRILSEKKRKSAARKVYTESPLQADFIVPVDGRISSIFGLRRFFNKQPRRPHSGLDIAAPQGTPIRAVADGTVIEAGDFFFSGNMLYLDHGQGLMTLYAHMHTLDVKPGDRVKQGQVIGTVGETGRVTGPHLHMAVIANQSTVDPLLFLPQLEEKAAAYFRDSQ